jgi:hypothetical protein
VKDGEPVDWRYDLGEDVYVIIKAPQLRIHIRKYFVPNGEWTLHPTKRGVTLSLYEWKELKKTIPLFEDRGPEPPPPPPSLPLLHHQHDSVEIPPKTRYKQKQNETHYENITHFIHLTLKNTILGVLHNISENNKLYM